MKLLSALFSALYYIGWAAIIGGACAAVWALARAFRREMREAKRRGSCGRRRP